MDTVTKRIHRLGWCEPGQARFWNLEEPSHRCPSKLGEIVCGCPCHTGVDPDEVNRQDRLQQKRREEELREPRPKKSRFKRKAWDQ